MRSLVLRSWFLLAAALPACSADPASEPAAPAVTPYVAPPSSAVIEEGAVRIRREVFHVAGVTPPPNPVAASDAETPAEYNRVRVVRYRVEADPPRPARAVAVLVSGFLGGAGSYDAMARSIVRRSTDGGAYEAWAIDRRANLLEDQHGLDVAEVRRDPELAVRYYFEDEEIEGKRFGGFVSQALVPYESEWGLPTTVGDLRRVIQLVGEADRKARVVLVGHSLGASVAEEYAAWDFDGDAGHDDLAGLVLVDGGSGVEGAAEPALTKDAYEQGGEQGGLAGFSAPGLDAIRATTRYIALPFLGLNVYPVASIASMRAEIAPGAITVDPYRDKAFATLMSLTTVPAMTNRAALGLAFDDASNGVTFAAVSCGSAVGPMEKYDSLLGVPLDHPSDAETTYDWVDFDEASPPEHTSLHDLARSWYDGPALDFAEWYFPARLSLDVQAAGTLVLEPGSYLLDEQGLRATHGASMDLPILAAAAGILQHASAFDALKGLVAGVPIGPGRPLEGSPRTDEGAFDVVELTGLTHIDPLSGTDGGSAAVTGWYDTLVAWMTKNTPDGGVLVPVQGE